MKCLDVNDDPLERGFYVETFYKGVDEHRNRIVFIGLNRTPEEIPHATTHCSITNRASVVPLNHNYSKWLRPFDEELDAVYQPQFPC